MVFYVLLSGNRFPQAKTAVTENHPLEFSEKHVRTLCIKRVIPYYYFLTSRQAFKILVI